MNFHEQQAAELRAAAGMRQEQRDALERRIVAVVKADPELTRSALLTRFRISHNALDRIIQKHGLKISRGRV